MMYRICLLLCVLTSQFRATAQVSITNAGMSITENFNSLPGSPDNSAFSWSDNTSLTGWYLSTTTCRIEASPSGMDNTGAIYTVVSDSDHSLGSKASATTGTLYYGFRLKNDTGQTISSIEVSYYGEQWSIAENETNLNEITFSYQVGSSVTSLTSGTWTDVSGLTFSQLYTSAESPGMGGSACTGFVAQCLALDGNASANRKLCTACFDVILLPGNEIMLRWTDVDTPANDHHLQIDDIVVSANNVSCSVALPVVWGRFDGLADEHRNELWWETITEANASHFEIERRTASTLFTPIGMIPCKGESQQPTLYYFEDKSPIENEVNYYRLKQFDRNGAFEISEMIAITSSENRELYPGYDAATACIRFSRPLRVGTEMTCIKLSGEQLFQTKITEVTAAWPFLLRPGLYLITVTEPAGEQCALKLLVL